MGWQRHGAGDVEREIESARHHADDCVVLCMYSSQANRAAHDGRIAGKPALPQIIAEDDLLVVAGLILRAQKEAPRERRHAEQGQQVRRNAPAVERIGLACR